MMNTKMNFNTAKTNRTTVTYMDKPANRAVSSSTPAKQSTSTPNGHIFSGSVHEIFKQMEEVGLLWKD
jgi:hypothetical protein